MTSGFILSTLLMAAAVTPDAGVSKTSTNVRSFARYKVILDRSPFSPPAGSVELPVPGFATRFGFIGTAQTNEDAPVEAFIQDKEANNRIYVKSEGGTISSPQGTVTIVSIDQSPRAKLVLKQGLETATLTMETKASVGATPSPSAPHPEANPFAPARATPGVPSGLRRIPFRRGG
jgi:hypothetical protein